MTKTSLSICSINNLTQEPQQDDSLFTPEQLDWIDGIELPKRLLLINASEFDDKFLTLTSDWRYRFSGENKAILFASGRNFVDLSASSVKLLKYLTVEYIKENSASGADGFADRFAKILAALEVVSRESLIAQLKELVAKVQDTIYVNKDFYYTLYALRRLERIKFFKSTGDKGDIEDLLLEVPRPRNGGWGRYQNLDLVIPDEVCLMIENGVQLWASKLCPKLETKESKIKHFEKLKKAVKVEVLRECIIIGIIYYTGARPVQIGKMAGGDYVVDTVNEHGMRYSFLVPYAKQSKLAIHRVRVAIPEELGKLITLYKHLEKIGDEDQLFPTKLASKAMVDKSIQNMLLRFSPKEIQEAVKNKDYKLPTYTASLFRHNVGHSMAMNGASAAEIAYIMGHTNYTVADKYIAATPEMADIREQALGRNPVFKNMMALMLTGNLIHSTKWEGRKVAASIGGKLHHHIGGCSYEENICPFSQGRACYGCLYFMPFTDGNHKEALDSFFDEIDEIRNIADDAGQVHHPVMTELVRRKDHVLQVMARIEMVQAKEGNE
ncbi:tyrosine-type recombinase/integrase [Vibrio sp. Isolate31]|uniref:tyrosine-type recombinase/integrase n=1 Tax=Vibrio sp. Isolate31 TaxID=2908537 RepID=UPI001EFEDFB7|nr:tyrosine-type recombinase/integrase [Vibrio sp. Isolate31]MCG9602230.1 tyrosine-type recombinase/integrase [Vibrio sp. Isolate31]